VTEGEFSPVVESCDSCGYEISCEEGICSSFDEGIHV
jgi:hypothetical protein